MKRKSLTVLTVLLALALNSLAQTASYPYIPNNRWGVVEGVWFPDLTCELGVGWERLIFNWAQHQPEGPQDWFTLNVDDAWLKAANACNREVVALLKHTPAWATDGIPAAGLPRGLDLPIDHPDNLWANFVRRAADYYASRGVRHFIIWNEPDIQAGVYGYEFEGQLEDYYQLLKVAYLAAKQGNPQAVIHLAGTTYWHDVNEGRQPYFERLMDRIVADPEARANDFYFDVMSLHIYFRSQTIYDLVKKVRQMLNARGMAHKAIWINETNAAPTDDPDWPVIRPQFPLNLRQQAAFLVQAAALGLAAGAERMAVYKLYDQSLPEGGESFGLLNPASAERRPAFYAWQMVTRTFSDVRVARLAQTERLDVVRLGHADGRQSLVMWARTDQPVQVRLSAAPAKIHMLDMLGQVQVMIASDGTHSLNIPPALCPPTPDGCFIGGEPLIVMLSGPLPRLEAVSDGRAQTFNFAD
ncbi:MAG: glycosyl hydrolase [Anaerolineae bacterium]|nr:glycosyl hydrolase [Anaerolineae bacterium]MDW8171464.1 glycosyl hydrolase [Anaerolineae bacterium]